MKDCKQVLWYLSWAILQRWSYYTRGNCKLCITEKPPCVCEFAENGVHAYPKNISTKRATRVTSLARTLQLLECPCATWSFDKTPVGT